LFSTLRWAQITGAKGAASKQNGNIPNGVGRAGRKAVTKSHQPREP